MPSAIIRKNAALGPTVIASHVPMAPPPPPPPRSRRGQEAYYTRWSIKIRTLILIDGDRREHTRYHG